MDPTKFSSDIQSYDYRLGDICGKLPTVSLHHSKLFHDLPRNQSSSRFGSRSRGFFFGQKQRIVLQLAISSDFLDDPF
jgi:hypothetical protein